MVDSGRTVRGGFTGTELLVVLGMILLAGLLLWIIVGAYTDRPPQSVAPEGSLPTMLCEDANRLGLAAFQIDGGVLVFATSRSQLRPGGVVFLPGYRLDGHVLVAPKVVATDGDR